MLTFKYNSRRRSGFTLPEILVSISLVAILAAVVVPTITSQVRKGDPNRIGNDFLAIRGAVEQFLSDVRRYPASIGQLAHPIKTTQAGLASTMVGNFAASDSTKWRGPYLTKDSAQVMATGFGLTMKSKFDIDTLDVSATKSAAGFQKYLVLAIPVASFDSLAALEIDKQFDDGVLASGSIRYRICAAGIGLCSPTTAADTLKFLVMPIY